jgi:soluble lytic murein transglycosylase-like protein
MASAISVPPCWSDSFSPRFDSEFQHAATRWLGAGPDWRWTKAQGVQESGLDPAALSPVGARGIMQVMPATWAEIQKAMGWRGVSPHSAPHNIFGGVWYQARMARIWSGRDRTTPEAYALGLASYNAGAGTILRAQARCADARLWSAIAPCLVSISGPANARQTVDYVQRIARWRAQMDAQ